MSAPSSPSARRLSRTSGFVLLLLAPLCALAAVGYALMAPRLFSASTTFRLTDPASDVPKLSAAFEKSKAYYLSVMKAPLPERVKLEPAGTGGEYRITATDRSPIKTSDGANLLTIGIRDVLRDSAANANDDIPRFPLMIQARAEMPRHPSHPDVPLVMQIGVYSAILCAVAGVCLRRAGREPSSPSAPAPAPSPEAKANPPTQSDPPGRTFDY